MTAPSGLDERVVIALERIADALEKLVVTHQEVERPAGGPMPPPVGGPVNDLPEALAVPGWIAVPTPYNTAMHVAYVKEVDAGTPVMVSICSATSFSGFDLGRAMPVAQVAAGYRCGSQACRHKYQWLTEGSQIA